MVLYLRPLSKPKIRFRLVISSFLAILVAISSRTFISFPFNGKTPIRLRSSEETPEMTEALAESPSVKINTASEDFLVPAYSAGEYLGIPRMVFFFLPSDLRSSRKLVIFMARSATPNLYTPSMNLSDTVHEDPNFP